MRSRSTLWILIGLLLLAGAWLFWPSGQHNATQKQTIAKPDFASMRSASTAPSLFAVGKTATNTVATAKTNKFAYRLSNTPKTIGQLMNDPHAILLENALIDSSATLSLAIPKNLQAQGDPGAYIIQARGSVDNAFRTRLAAAGAQIVSYIPNNAYLVTVSAGGAAGLTGQPGVQSVIPYEPYYKLPESLMPWVGKTFPADRQLRVAAYPNTADQLRTVLAKSGAKILTEEPSSPFGSTFIIQNVADIAALARQADLQRLSRRSAVPWRTIWRG